MDQPDLRNRAQQRQHGEILKTLARAADAAANMAARDDIRTLDASSIRDIRPLVLDESGRMRVLPAAFWASTTAEERMAFGSRTGIYGFPTIELVTRLQELIDGRPAIEIGAGHGVLAQALGIPATDNRMQEKPEYVAIYTLNGAVTVPYGPEVVEMHASRAVRRYQPQVVIGSWVTHKYDPARHEAGGNEIGIDEEDILRNCETYIMIGHENTHSAKKIWERKHTIEFPGFLVLTLHESGSGLYCSVARVER